ncbi:MAG: T9SS type A sorting domain-containing protein, partial [Bacteroidia bacterium]
IIMSNDTCNTWAAMGIYPSASSFFDLFMVNDSIGYAVGSSGIIYKTYPGAIAPPTTASSSLYTSSITNTSMTVNWTSGNGTRRMVIARASSSSMSDPTNGTSYTANSIYGSGYTVGTGNYVVYDGTGNSCSITGLALNTTYFFRVYEYNGTGTSTIYYTGAYGSIGAMTLPVKLTEFTATILGENKVQLNWSTSSEINNNYFSIERSQDNEHYESIGTVKGNGNSNITINYNFNDETPLTGTSYYRLKQVDLDGKFSLSEVKVVSTNKSRSSVAIYPNPTNGILNIEIESAEQKNISINLYDVNGRNILNEKRIVISGKQTFQFNSSTIPSGIYFLNVSDKSGSSIGKQKIVIE